VRVQDGDRLGVVSAVPDDERAVVVAGHELLAVMEPAD